MAKNGYIRLERKLFDSDLWTAEPFTPGQAWVDLIAMANYADRDKFYRGTFQRVKRGQIVTSKLALATRWKWSDGRVRRYLATLERAQMVRIDSGPNGVLLTIENYILYQDARRTNSGPNDEPATNERRTNDEPATTQEQKINKDNEIKQRERAADAAAVPLSVADVSTFVLENGLDVDSDAFWNYYEANGWTTKAGQPVRNWKALCRTWNGKPQYNKHTNAPADPDGLTPEMRASVERVKARRNEH